jgi:hypothetical protein
VSAGDIDDRLGPATELERLEATNVELRKYLAWARTNIAVERATIPFGGGISKDGKTAYVHPDLDCTVTGINCIFAVATHEFTEWALREFCKIGVDYADDPRGHRLANRAEANEVARLGVELDAYDEHLDPQLIAIEHAPLTNVPKDLALYPYEDDEHIMHKIRRAQNDSY